MVLVNFQRTGLKWNAAFLPPCSSPSFLEYALSWSSFAFTSRAAPCATAVRTPLRAHTGPVTAPGQILGSPQFRRCWFRGYTWKPEEL